MHSHAEACCDTLVSYPVKRDLSGDQQFSVISIRTSSSPSSRNGRSSTSKAHQVPSHLHFKCVDKHLKCPWASDQAVFSTNEKDRRFKPEQQHTHTHTHTHQQQQRPLGTGVAGHSPSVRASSQKCQKYRNPNDFRSFCAPAPFCKPRENKGKPGTNQRKNPRENPEHHCR